MGRTLGGSEGKTWTLHLLLKLDCFCSDCFLGDLWGPAWRVTDVLELLQKVVFDGEEEGEAA